MSEQIIKTEKLIFGGEALGETKEGQKALLWNALPKEEVAAATYKKKGTTFGVATEVVTPSTERIPPKEEHFLSCSPWQIIKEEKEIYYKKEVVKELFSRQFDIALPEFNIIDSKNYYHYRNKMEFSFYGDEKGVSLAFFQRGSKGKIKIKGCELAKEGINKVAKNILEAVNKTELRAGDLKSLIIRENQEGEVIAGLFSKTKNIPDFLLSLKIGDINSSIKGFAIYYSEPKSPMSVATELIFKEGDLEFYEKILNKKFKIHLLGFSQVNIPVFEEALKKIKEYTEESKKVLDLYAGSGAIGLNIDRSGITLVEEIPEAVRSGKENIKINNILNAEFILAKAEESLNYINKNQTLIVDPPRSGLHPKLVARILAAKPKKIIYLSCNPSTQGRDLKELLNKYKLVFFEGYNFFPRTPHLETLAVLQLKADL